MVEINQSNLEHFLTIISQFRHWGQVVSRLEYFMLTFYGSYLLSYSSPITSWQKNSETSAISLALVYPCLPSSIFSWTGASLFWPSGSNWSWRAAHGQNLWGSWRRTTASCAHLPSGPNQALPRPSSSAGGIFVWPAGKRHRSVCLWIEKWRQRQLVRYQWS